MNPQNFSELSLSEIFRNIGNNFNIGEKSSIRPIIYPNIYVTLTPQGYGLEKITSKPFNDNIVAPQKIHLKSVEIIGNIDSFSKNWLGEGYISSAKSGLLSEISPVSGIGGVIDSSQSNKKYLTINKPLTLHNQHHRNLLVQAYNIIQNIIKNNQNNFNQNQLTNFSELTQLINMILYIDDFPTLPQMVIEEALSNFFIDLAKFPSSTWIKSPLNYILDSLQIDGLCYENQGIFFEKSYLKTVKYTC